MTTIKYVSTKTLAISSLILCSCIFTAVAYGDVVRWKRVNGIVETGNLVGSGTGIVSGAGQPFSTIRGRARVNLATGRFRFRVRGLSFAGGNPIGTTGPFTQVLATLLCDTDGSAGGGNSVRNDTPLVPLSSEGNASFKGWIVLDPVCSRESDNAFLILNPNDMWVANGAVRVFPDVKSEHWYTHHSLK